MKSGTMAGLKLRFLHRRSSLQPAIAGLSCAPAIRPAAGNFCRCHAAAAKDSPAGRVLRVWEPAPAQNPRISAPSHPPPQVQSQSCSADRRPSDQSAAPRDPRCSTTVPAAAGIRSSSSSKVFIKFRQTSGRVMCMCQASPNSSQPHPLGIRQRTPPRSPTHWVLHSNAP
jgi:hypothetical protein